MNYWFDNPKQRQNSPVPPHAARNADNFAADVTALYAQYGREAPTPQEVAAHRGNPEGLPAIAAMLQKDNLQGGTAPVVGQPTPTQGNPWSGAPFPSYDRTAPVVGAPALDMSKPHGAQDAWLDFVTKNFSDGSGRRSRGANRGGFANGGKAYQSNLQPVVDAFNNAHGTKATVAGADQVDFGDGRGPINVITSDGLWAFGGAAGR